MIREHLQNQRIQLFTFSLLVLSCLSLFITFHFTILHCFMAHGSCAGGCSCLGAWAQDAEDGPLSWHCAMSPEVCDAIVVVGSRYPIISALIYFMSNRINYYSVHPKWDYFFISFVWKSLIISLLSNSILLFSYVSKVLKLRTLYYFRPSVRVLGLCLQAFKTISSVYSKAVAHSRKWPSKI